MTPSRAAAAASFGTYTAVAIVISNMVGTGIFTSLGFQLLDIQSPFVVLMLWLVGGAMALCGALTYAELGTALPRSGGEYNFLAEIYHPAAGFVSGWTTATIGFAAPTALAAITSGTYLASVFPALSPRWIAILLIAALAAVHATTRRSSGGTQRALTFATVLLIAVFCVLGWTVTESPQDISLLPAEGDGPLLASAAFAVALIYVNYAYSGWNAATYVTGELDRPRQTLTRVLLIGTGIVMVLYMMLNYTFLYAAPMAAMAGKIEIGYVAAGFIFGETGGAIMGTMLALLLVATVSAMTLAGPRALLVIGEDFRALGFLARTNAHGVPVVAIGFQSVLAIGFVLTGTFESILVLTGFTLGLSMLLVVLGVFVLRWRRPDLERPYRVPLYPLPPLVFVSLMGWTLTYILLERPAEGLVGAGIVAAGAAFYAGTRRLSRPAA